MATRARPHLILVVVLGALGGCATTRAVLDPPAGFAVFAGESLWRAVSPEGVVMRARLVVNDPPQTLTFWAQALKTQMERSGYTLTAEESLLSPGGPGILYEWAAPVGEEDWIYLTALFVLDKRIALTEAAGEFTLYRKHRPAILNSLGTLALR